MNNVAVNVEHEFVPVINPLNVTLTGEGGCT
jgi:hypothetical protein